MAPVGITARFPLGVYHGHLPDGSPDFLPSPARLFSALVSAAHTGSVAGSEGDLSSEIADALTWLEKHPPNGIRVPSHVPVSDSSITSGLSRSRNDRTIQAQADAQGDFGRYGCRWPYRLVLG